MERDAKGDHERTGQEFWCCDMGELGPGQTELVSQREGLRSAVGGLGLLSISKSSSFLS